MLRVMPVSPWCGKGERRSWVWVVIGGFGTIFYDGKEEVKIWLGKEERKYMYRVGGCWG